MKREVIRRPEMDEAVLRLGANPVDLADYATTGLVALAVSPRGYGKTNAGLLMAEQLSAQGWVSVLIDPESELEMLYGDAVSGPDELEALLISRERPIIVVAAKDAGEFIPYGRTILRVADDVRKPLFIVIDEGQLFSGTRLNKNTVGEASDIVNEMVARGRKRAIDIFVTALQFTGTLNRLIFSSKNLTLVGCQEDPASWSNLAPQFRGSKIEFSDLNALAPGEFFCFSRRGVEKVKMPIAAALRKVAAKARPAKKTLPTTFKQWVKAMSEIPTDRLEALDQPVIDLLSTVVGLTPQQSAAGFSALQDELECRL